MPKRIEKKRRRDEEKKKAEEAKAANGNTNDSDSEEEVKEPKKKKIKIEKDVIIKHEPTDADYYILPTPDNTTSGEGSKKIKKEKKTKR